MVFHIIIQIYTLFEFSSLASGSIHTPIFPNPHLLGPNIHLGWVLVVHLSPIKKLATRPHFIYLNVCKASRKWHTSKSQPPFTCDCGVSSSGSRTLSVGGTPQAREVCVVPQEQCGVVTLCDLPGPPEPLHHCLKRNGIKRKKINTSLTLPWQRHRLPQGGANVFWIQDPPFPKKVTGGCPCCLATGQYPQLPKFLESEPTYEK